MLESCLYLQRHYFKREDSGYPERNYLQQESAKCLMLFLLNSVADVTMRRSRRQTLPRRRPYTASDLVSAVRAICLGQLGTRRAASVYGIPRSTLRNKICKLNEIKKHEEAACGGKPISLSDFIQQSNWAGKLSYDTSGSSGNDVRCSSAVESIFKVW